MPPCDSATARTIASPRPEPRPPSRPPRTNRSKIRRCELGGDPGTVVLDRRAPRHRPRRRCEPARGCRAGVWRSAFSIRLSASRCRSSRAPETSAAFGSTDEIVVGRDRPELAGGLGQDLAEIGRPVRLDALRVGAREQQQVADEAPHPPGRAQRRVRGLGLLAVELLGEQLEVREHARQRRAQLVRGVGDELALAVEHRLGVGARRVERARASPRACARARRPRRRPRDGAAAGSGRGCARSRARRRSAAAIGRIARCAVASPASSASTLPPSTPRIRKKRTRASVCSTSDSGRA